MSRADLRAAAAAAVLDAIAAERESDSALAARIGWPRQRVHEARAGARSVDYLLGLAHEHRLSVLLSHDGEVVVYRPGADADDPDVGRSVLGAVRVAALAVGAVPDEAPLDHRVRGLLADSVAPCERWARLTDDD